MLNQGTFRSGPHRAQDEWAFWAGMKRNGLAGFNPRVLEVARKGHYRPAAAHFGNVDKSHLSAGMVQEWAHRTEGWKLVAAERGDFSVEPARRLPFRT